jgi:hypothetical protein
MQDRVMGMMKKAYKKKKKNLTKPGVRFEHRWDDNIKTDSNQIQCNGTD